VSAGVCRDISSIQPAAQLALTGRIQAMTDDELIEAYHEALCGYQVAKIGRRTDAFVQFTSAEAALISRFGIDRYQDYYEVRRAPAAMLAVLAQGLRWQQ
jgi:hypothetical protein